MTNKQQWVLSPEGKEFSTWGGARPGSGRPRVRRILELTHEQACMLVAALECYSNESYSTAEDYDPKPLEELRVLVDELATMGPLL